MIYFINRLALWIMFVLTTLLFYELLKAVTGKDFQNAIFIIITCWTAYEGTSYLIKLKKELEK